MEVMNTTNASNQLNIASVSVWESFVNRSGLILKGSTSVENYMDKWVVPVLKDVVNEKSNPKFINFVW